MGGGWAGGVWRIAASRDASGFVRELTTARQARREGTGGGGGGRERGQRGNWERLVAALLVALVDALGSGMRRCTSASRFGASGLVNVTACFGSAGRLWSVSANSWTVALTSLRKVMRKYI